MQEIIADNFAKLEEMAEYFTDETDPTIGKLYINYPMMESFRDCDAFFDEKYEQAVVAVNDIKGYKQAVQKKALCRMHIDKFERGDFELLILQNVFKLNKLLKGIWEKPTYEEYRDQSEAGKILGKEKELVETKDCISVLNTSLYMIVDYFGNKYSFYDSLSAE